MKKIGILSDTHGCWDDRYATYFDECDEIWHAGDIGDYSIIERLQELVPVVRAVSGNIDHGITKRMCQEVLMFKVEQVSVLLTHIGGYPGRWANGMKRMLSENKIRLMVDGHSHILKVMPDRELDLLHINPGAAGKHGWQQVRTIVRLEIDGDIIRNLEVIEMY